MFVKKKKKGKRKVNGTEKEKAQAKHPCMC